VTPIIFSHPILVLKSRLLKKSLHRIWKFWICKWDLQTKNDTAVENSKFEIIFVPLLSRVSSKNLLRYQQQLSAFSNRHQLNSLYSAEPPIFRFFILGSRKPPCLLCASFKVKCIESNKLSPCEIAALKLANCGSP